MGNNTKTLVIRLKKNNESLRLVTIFAFLSVVCMPFSTISIGGIGVMLLISIPFLILCIPTLLRCIKKTRWDKATVFLAAFFVYGLLGYIWTPSVSLYSVYNYIKNVMIVMCLYCQSFNIREKKFLLFGTIIAATIVCFFMITGNNVGFEDGRTTIAIFGEVQDPNYVGFVFYAPLAIMIDQIMNCERFFLKIICLISFFVILYCVILTGSRGAIIGITIIIIVTFISKFKTIWGKVLFCAIMMFCAFVLFNFVLMFVSPEMAARYSVQSVLETGGTGRTTIWLNAWKTMKESPYMLLLGFGTGSSVSVIGRATHNYIIQLLLELGIVGTVLFFKYFWIWVKRLAKQDTLCLSIILGCMGLSMSLSVNTNYYFWMVMTLGIVCSKAKMSCLGGNKQ